MRVRHGALSFHGERAHAYAGSTRGETLMREDSRLCGPLGPLRGLLCLAPGLAQVQDDPPS